MAEFIMSRNVALRLHNRYRGICSRGSVDVSFFYYFSVSMFLSFAVFCIRISTPSAGFIFLTLPLEEKLKRRLLRLWIIREKETLFSTRWLLSLYFIFGKDIPRTRCSKLGVRQFEQKGLSFCPCLAFQGPLVQKFLRLVPVAQGRDAPSTSECVDGISLHLVVSFFNLIHWQLQ